MESTSLSSNKETLVAFRIAAKDLEFFKRMAEDHYKRGDIKTPTLAALAKWNLYWTCNMLKDLEKARILTDQQRQRSISPSELEEPRPLSRAKIKDYDHPYNYCDNTYPSYQLPQPNAPQIPYPNEIAPRSQSGDVSEEDYNFHYNGKSITRPFFYELFPDWQQTIPQTRTKREQ